jgi:hypothetical protein
MLGCDNLCGESRDRYCSKSCSAIQACRRRLALNKPKQLPLRGLKDIQRRRDASELKRRAFVTSRHRDITCKQCGDPFRQRRWKQLFCSTRCCRRYAKWMRLNRGLSCIGVKFSSYDVLNRDRWRCQHCGIDTPKGLRGTIEPNAPEVDHIKPLSRGGVHALWNVQCLCRRCNQAKGDRLPLIDFARLADHWRLDPLKDVVFELRDIRYRAPRRVGHIEL